MPGKVNPVICEAVIQAGAQVMGDHVAVTVGAQWGQLDLNTMLPLIIRNLLESIRLLANVARLFADKAVAGLAVNEETCRAYVEISPSMATALNPLVGYDRAAEIAKRAFRERRPVRELAREMTDLTPEQLAVALQEDGKILFTGSSYEESTSRYGIIVGRRNRDGSPDTSFGSHGITRVMMGKSFATSRRIASQQDGRIVVAGDVGTKAAGIHSRSSRYPSDLVLFRLTPNGQLDENFGLRP